MFFGPLKKIVLAEKIFSVQNTRTKQQNEGLRIARNMHHKDTHLCLKQTPISHLWAPAGNDAALLCVCSREEPRREYQTEQSTLRLELFFFSSCCFGLKIFFEGSKNTTFFLRGQKTCVAIFFAFSSLLLAKLALYKRLFQRTTTKVASTSWRKRETMMTPLRSFAFLALLMVFSSMGTTRAAAMEETTNLINDPFQSTSCRDAQMYCEQTIAPAIEQDGTLTQFLRDERKEAKRTESWESIVPEERMKQMKVPETLALGTFGVGVGVGVHCVRMRSILTELSSFSFSLTLSLSVCFSLSMY